MFYLAITVAVAQRLALLALVEDRFPGGPLKVMNYSRIETSVGSAPGVYLVSLALGVHTMS